MDWKKWSGKAAQYAADGAAEKTVEFAFTKVGPYRVAGIVANVLMVLALFLAAAGWYLQSTVGFAGVFYTVAIFVFAAGLLINLVKNYLFNKAKSALTSGVGWAAGAVKRRYLPDQDSGKKPPASDNQQPGTK